MFRTLAAFVFALVLVGYVGGPAAVAKDEPKDSKSVKLEGKITCPKCDLAIADKCGTVIKTADGKLYWFDEASNKKYHKDICTDPKDGKVEGTVKKDGEKMFITVTKLEYKK